MHKLQPIFEEMFQFEVKLLVIFIFDSHLSSWDSLPIVESVDHRPTFSMQQPFNEFFLYPLNL